jgi:uncharacterized protein YndB with AHSA1/START domain
LPQQARLVVVSAAIHMLHRRGCCSEIGSLVEDRCGKVDGCERDPQLAARCPDRGDSYDVPVKGRIMTKNQNTYSIEHVIEIAGAAPKVLAAVSTKEGFAGWWTRDLACDSAKREATFRFAKPEHTCSMTFHLDALDDASIVMTCIREDNQPEWLGTELAIRLASTPVGTRVQLVHAGFRARTEHFDVCVKGWAFFLGSLKSYVETGVGQPFESAPSIAAASA